MEVPGIRRVRSRTFRGATEISAQFDAATDMIVALQQVQNRVAEARPDLPPRPRPGRRSPDADGVSVLHPRPHRRPVVRGPARLRVLRDAAGARARRRRRARRSAVERHARDRSDRRSGAGCAAAGLTVDDVAGALQSANVLAPVGRFTERRSAAPGARVRACGDRQRHRRDAGVVKGGADAARSRSGHRRPGRAGSHDADRRRRRGRRDDRGLAADRRQHPDGAAGRRRSARPASSSRCRPA